MASLNLNLLQVFHLAAELSSFTRAAEALHLTQPGISKHVRDLEEYYGTRLFDRLGKKVALTHAGVVLYGTTKAIFNLLGETKLKIDDLEGLAAGKLTIAATITVGTYILPGILAEFTRGHPNVELAVDMALSGQVAEKVLDNSAEIGLIGHSIEDARLVSEKFLTDELLLIVSCRHNWAHRRSITPIELSGQPFIVSKEGSGTRITVEKKFKESGIRLKRMIEFGNTEGVKKAVESNLGVSILSKHTVAREIAAGLIKPLALPGIDMERSFHFIYRRNKYITQAMRRFLSLLKERQAE